ncbi:uncharacterized protein CXorf65 homolog isoform X2 [Lasioglossum baleicum]|uniref:uncharacterized protein CXorf65 homolog isoform X2 n=1 Tax=Lasioglossum baleicum TaxID=434251 RepID=UPI003FCE81E9
MTSIITIKYAGIDEIEHVLLVNINCPLKLILNYIRSAVGLNETDEFDLCDEEHCHLKNVSFYEPHASGLNIFQIDLTYLIVIFERDANGTIINVVPLIKGKAAKRCTDIIMKSQITQKNSSSVKSTLKKNHNRNKAAN